MGCSDVTFYTGETIVDEEYPDEETWVCYEMTLTDGIWRCTLPDDGTVIEDKAFFSFMIGDIRACLSLDGDVKSMSWSNRNYDRVVIDGLSKEIWCDYNTRIEGAASCYYIDHYDYDTGAYLGSEVSENWDYTDEAFYDADGELIYVMCYYAEYYCFIPGDGWREYYPDGPRVEPPDFMKSYTEDYFKCKMPCLKPSAANPRPVPSTWDAVLPDGLTTVESNAFLNTDISTVYIPDGVTAVATDAFSGCVLTYARIPGSLVNFDGLLRADVLVVPEGSYAHEYLKDREILYVLE